MNKISYTIKIFWGIQNLKVHHVEEVAVTRIPVKDKIVHEETLLRVEIYGKSCEVNRAIIIRG